MMTSPLVASLAVLAATAPAAPVLQIPVAPFRESIERPASVESTSARLVRAPGFADERILIWLAEEGTEVEKGDVIARFDPTPVQHGLERSILKSQEARDRVESLETDWTIRLDSERIRANQLEEALEEAVRGEAATRFLPEIPKSIASIKRDIAAGQAEGAETKISLLRDSAQRQLKSAADQSQVFDHERESTSQNLHEIVIRARDSGLVTHLPVTLSGLPARKVQTGDSLERNQPFLQIHPPHSSQLQISLSARELPLVQHGQDVEFALRAEPERWLKAKILEVQDFAIPASKGKAPSFAVIATISQQPGLDNLRPAMTAIARIHIARTGNTLAIPIDWVFYDGKNRLLCQSPDGRWQAMELPPETVRAGDFLLLPPTFAQADDSGSLLIQAPPQGSQHAQWNSDVFFRQ